MDNGIDYARRAYEIRKRLYKRLTNDIEELKEKLKELKKELKETLKEELKETLKEELKKTLKELKEKLKEPKEKFAQSLSNMGMYVCFRYRLEVISNLRYSNALFFIKTGRLF